MRSALRVLPLLGAGSLLLTHLLTAAVFRRRTDAVIARLEDASVVELSTPPVPAIIHSCARRSVCANPVPNTVWLSQRGEIRANTGGHWRPFTAEQVISIHEPGFAWLAQMQGRPSHRRAFLTATWMARVSSKRASSARCAWRMRRGHR
jgi:uncharacterized protein DUF6544